MSEEKKLIAELQEETVNVKQSVQAKQENISGQVNPPTLYDTHIKENFHIFGLASILYGILYVFCMYKNDAGITYPLFVLGTIGYIVFVMYKLEMKLKKSSWFFVICMLLLAVSTCCTDDARIILCNKTGVFLLTICMLLEIVYNTRKWQFVKYIASIAQVCVMSCGEICTPFENVVWYCKNKLGKKNSKYLYLLIGVGITIPVFVIVFMLLSSADAVFRNMSSRIFSDFSFVDAYRMALMFSFMALFSYCLVVYLSKRAIKEEITETRKWNSFIAIPVTGALSLMYLVFSGIQIVYLFMGKMQLPEGYTYAEYAREGFFQLLAVSIINLILVLAGLYLFQPNKILKGILVVMSLCTFIMIASSALRMLIYIQYYYLTFLRILVLWSLLVLFLIFVGVIAYIAKEDFPLFRYSIVVFTCLYIGLSFSHPDYWIAKVNLESTKEVRNEFFKGEPYSDYGFLGDLNADAAPVMLEWIAEEGYTTELYFDETLTYDEYRVLNQKDTEEDKRALKTWSAYHYLKNLREQCSGQSFRELNFSRYFADYKVSLMKESK